MKNALLGIVIALAVVVASASVYVALRQHLTYNDTPMPAVTASTDSAVIERGRYVVRNLASCPICHGDPKQYPSIVAGEEVPLSGGFEFKIPPGNFYARNITPDETGIGHFTDGQIARALRSGVGNDGRALLPFMEMQGLSDEDLIAVVSYLRSQPPVHTVVPAHEPNLLGHVVIATVLAKPIGPKETPPQRNPSGATVENGRYLVESVANCWACHTQRNPNTGALVGPHLGGATMADDWNPKRTWAPPNLTSDPTTGRLAQFTEDQFVERMRAGRAFPGSPMPWQGFRKLHEEDLRAIFRYLKTLPPIVHDTGPPFVDKP
jgi:mono/diheme cytochrome c family protein